PLTRFCWTPRVELSMCWTSAAVPVVNEALWGVEVCAKPTAPVIMGSSAGGRSPGDAGRRGEHAGGDGGGVSARPRVQQVGVRHLRPVALEFDIQVVLERQRDGILQRKVQVAAAQ